MISNLVNDSVYSEKRLAQPDEVWNFGRGDGIEKALLLASWFYHYDKCTAITIEIKGEEVSLNCNDQTYSFSSAKGFVKKITIQRDQFSVV